MTAVDLGPEARQRAEAYRLLSTLYAARLERDTLSGLVAVADESPGDGDGAADHILAALRGEATPERLAERLAAEHARLFRGIREGYGPPPPYESLWREGRIMGEATLDVASAYAEAGYAADPTWGPFDHLVEELRFMAALCHAEDQARDAGRAHEAAWARRRQQTFLQRHLAAWLPAYCAQLEREAREPLYRALARVTATIVAEDARHLLGSFDGSVGG